MLLHSNANTISGMHRKWKEVVDFAYKITNRKSKGDELLTKSL